MSNENQTVGMPEQVLRTALVYLNSYVHDQVKSPLDYYPQISAIWDAIRKRFLSDYSLGREQALLTLTHRFNNRALGKDLIKEANGFLHRMAGIWPPGYWNNGFPWLREDITTRFVDMSLNDWEALCEEEKDARFKQVLDGYLRFVVFNDVNNIKILMEVMKVEHPWRGLIPAFNKIPSDETFDRLRKDLCGELSEHLKGLTRGSVIRYIEAEQRRLDPK